MTSNTLPLILDAAALASLLQSDNVWPDNILPVAVCQEQVFTTRHIPGSVLVQPAELIAGVKPAVGKLPSAEQLSALFSRIGLTADTHVIAYDDEGGGWAGRLIWTLDVIGHRNYSYLDGGLLTWLAARCPLASGAGSPRATDYRVSIDSSQLLSMAAVQAQIGKGDSIVWDARSPEEYAGTKITTPRNGHIPGAVNLDWLELMDRDNHLRLLPLSQISARLQALGITHDKDIITHCQTHHRSGLTYLVGKALGMQIKAYDGSWAEWGNDPDTPIATGSGE